MRGATVEDCMWRDGRGTRRRRRRWNTEPENKFPGSWCVCSSFSCLCPTTIGKGRRQVESRCRKGKRVNRWRQRHDGVTVRQTVEGTRRTEWGLLLLLVKGSLQQEAAEKSNGFPCADTLELRGHCSHPCLWNTVWHMWPLYCVQHLLRGPQMEAAVLSLGCAPPNPGLVGGLLCDDVPLTAPAICQSIKACLWLLFFFAPLNVNPDMVRVGAGVGCQVMQKVLSVRGKNICTGSMKKVRAGRFTAAAAAKPWSGSSGESWGPLQNAGRQQESAAAADTWTLTARSLTSFISTVNSSDVLCSLLPWARCTSNLFQVRTLPKRTPRSRFLFILFAISAGLSLILSQN